MIVAVSHAGDSHLLAVRAALRRSRTDLTLLDLSQFPARGRLTIDHDEQGRSALLLLDSGNVIDSEEIECVWWRRPQQYSLDESLTGLSADFALEQVHAAFSGLWSSLAVSWVNDPYLTLNACHKVRQLALAERHGFAIPRTTITNEPARAAAFLESLGGRRTVCKPLRSMATCWKPTSLVTSEDCARLEDVRLSPTILQEYVEGMDVRITVVGSEIFAAFIDARHTTSPQDFRPAYAEAKVGSLELPTALSSKVLQLMNSLGLEFAAVDVRLQEDGHFVFLELNPAGQWLFVEARTGQLITSAFAAHLANLARLHTQGVTQPPRPCGQYGPRKTPWLVSELTARHG